MRISGGLIDRSQTLRFTFDGKAYEGHPGDTLASALLANGVRLMGRSFKYHRPRGVVAMGSEEPNALVTVGVGARSEPNLRASTVELYDGLVAVSQNRWPSLEVDALEINDKLNSFLTAGFYYKTFMWPRKFWEAVYEPIIRKAAGLGALSREADPDAYDKGFLHADLLVVGAGPAGLMAALVAGRAGLRVILADEDFRLGGRLLASAGEISGMGAADWAAGAVAELAALPTVRLMPRTTVFGTFDHGIHGAVERVGDHLADGGLVRQTLWRIYAPRTILAAGAIERPIAFENNDRPGIMQAGALAGYGRRWAALPGRAVAVFSNNDSGVRAALDLASQGAEVTLIDSRKAAPIAGLRHISEAMVVNTKGRLGLSEITLRTASGREEKIAVEALGVSGGWNPNIGLMQQHRTKPLWDESLAAFLPGVAPKGMVAVGAAKGIFSTHGALVSGAEAARAVVESMGRQAPYALPKAEDAPYAISPLYAVPGASRAWVDPQNDVTVKDIRLAHQESFRDVEHLKRYTTLGMATDQGKSSNLLGAALMAELTGQPISALGQTTYRPPFTPVALGALAGRSRGKDFKPFRLTPSHHWAKEQGAVFVEVGQWLRTQWIPQPGETAWRQSVDREVLATRAKVGICDVTTLGKIDIQGPDAGAFLDRVYANTFSTLAVGKCRYGVMLREDGMVMDDGTTARLAPDEWVMTTTTANAVPVFRHLEFCRQVLWPDLDVQIISTTEAWAQYSVAGPKARDLLQKLVDQDISDASLPYMGCAEITIGGLRARIFRISFSGEMAYEIAVPARYGDGLIRALVAAGEEFGAVVYGTEALGVMRVEKGHVAGNELNGTSTALMMGLGKMVSRKKEAIGVTLSAREAMVDPAGLRLVGIRPVDPAAEMKAGSHFLAEGAPKDAAHDDGWITSLVHSPHLGHQIALGYLKNGSARLGERLRVVNLLAGTDILAEVVSPHFIDPEGGRLRG